MFIAKAAFSGFSVDDLARAKRTPSPGGVGLTGSHGNV
jgi:hypothetical protein